MIGASSLVHVRFGIFIPRKSPNNAIKTVKIRGIIHIIIFSAMPKSKSTTQQASHNITGIPVTSICTMSFALSMFHGSTGSDCPIHMLFPSRDTEGTTISFIAAVTQIIVIIIATINP